MCGQHGTHLQCQRWKREPLQWVCDTCAGGVDDTPSRTLDQVVGDQSKSVDLKRDASESASEDSSSVLCITDDESEEELPLSVWCQGKKLSQHSSKKQKDCNFLETSSSDDDSETSISNVFSGTSVKHTVEMSNKRKRLNTPQRFDSCIHIKDTDSEDTSSEIDVEAIDERYDQEMSFFVRARKQIPEKDITKIGKKRCPCCQKLQRPTDQPKKQCPIANWLRGDDLKGIFGSISTSPLPDRDRVHPRSSFTTVKAKFSKKNVDKNEKKNRKLVKYQGSGVRKKSLPSSNSVLTISDSEDEGEATKTSVRTKCLEEPKTSLQPEKKVFFNEKWHDWSGGYLERSLETFYYLRSRNQSTKTHECLKRFPSDHSASS